MTKALIISQIIPYQTLNNKTNIVKLKKSNNMSIIKSFRRLFAFVTTLGLIFAIWKIIDYNNILDSQTTIIIITPTHKRPERFADMTRY